MVAIDCNTNTLGKPWVSWEYACGGRLLIFQKQRLESWCSLTLAGTHALNGTLCRQMSFLDQRLLGYCKGRAGFTSLQFENRWDLPSGVLRKLTPCIHVPWCDANLTTWNCTLLSLLGNLHFSLDWESGLNTCWTFINIVTILMMLQSSGPSCPEKDALSHT